MHNFKPLQLLNESAVHECIVRLLKSSSNEESLECAARLITIIGKDLDVPEAKVTAGAVLCLVICTVVYTHVPCTHPHSRSPQRS